MRYLCKNSVQRPGFPDACFPFLFQTTAALEADLVQERAATARLREALIAEQAQRAAAEAVAEDAYRKYRTSVAKARWKMAAAGTGVHDNTLQKSPSKTSSSSSSRREGMRKPGSLQTRCEELEGQVAELRATLQVRCNMFIIYCLGKNHVILVCRSVAGYKFRLLHISSLGYEYFACPLS